MTKKAAAQEAQEQHAGDVVKTVPMKRDPELFPQPHTADVHPDEVQHYEAAGFVKA